LNEVERIRKVYARRAELGLDERNVFWEPAALFTLQDRERAIVHMLRSAGFLPIRNRRILDVGCGGGSLLRGFLQLGAAPSNMVGVDLLESLVEFARKVPPEIDYRVLDASELPFDDSSFDLVTAFTMFSSVLDPTVRETIAREMRRVVKPDGALLVYDFWLNPVNSDTVPIRLRDVRNLFPDCEVVARRVTLAPPITRLLAGRAWTMCCLLNGIPWLRTHWLTRITPRS
jgi:2-polyprenyl-3-methyl-5-hydroxy-6-metoxy-1,4-benzoquinol methylase